MTEKPPKKPMEGKFGLVAYQKWAELLADTKSRQGWARHFAPGVRMYAGLKSAYDYLHTWDYGGAYSRRDFADFLDEAAVILHKSALTEVASGFRGAALCWEKLETALLPDEVEPLKETRDLIRTEVDLFITQGAASLDERRQISQRLKAIRQAMDTHFPLSETVAAALRDHLREAVLAVYAAEAEAINRLKAAMN